MLDFSRRQQKILHLTWIAFFLSFLAWFNMAPFNTTLVSTLGLNGEQIKILMVCNVALTIPARIVIGSLVDLFGPRKVYTAILTLASMICFQFALAESFLEVLIARLLMGIIGAGFVVGIKMIGEWFPHEKMGFVQGIYGGWGNFGAAAAAFILPPIASFFPSDIGWRIAVGFCGMLCLIWAFVYYLFSEDLPKNKQNLKLALDFRLEVTSRKDLVFLILSQIPIYVALVALIWIISGHPLTLFSTTFSSLSYGLLLVIFAINIKRNLTFNLPRLADSVPIERHYEFKQILILSIVYSLTFGSELAVISMFPQYLEDLFELTRTQAGILGSSFAFMNLITRPAGGWFSDNVGRKRSLVIILTGAVFCYMVMSCINSQWPLAGALVIAIICSIFLQAGNGSCFSMVPLIQKDLTGKMAGLAGAYGNVGSVLFLIVFNFVSATLFFKILAGYGIFVLFIVIFLRPFKQEKIQESNS